MSLEALVYFLNILPKDNYFLRNVFKEQNNKLLFMTMQGKAELKSGNVFWHKMGRDAYTTVWL